MSLQKKMLAGMIAAACSGMFATSAMAIMTYDLRFADGTKSKDALPGAYVVNLYAVIDHGGDNSFNTDSITGGQLNIYSGKVGAGAVAPGTNSGVTARAATLPTPNFSLATTADESGDLMRDANGAAAPNNVADVLGDGILDWGADERYITSGGGATAANPLLSAYHRQGVLIPSATKTYNWRFTQPFVPGGAVVPGVSQPSSTRPNSWEVLIGEFTINLAGVSPTATPTDKTTFTPFSHHRIRSTSSAPSASGGSNYSTDGNLPGSNPGGVSTPYGEGAFSGVEFVGIVPEPSTYVLCGLAAAAGVFGLRRRKTS
ncbi:MAG: PEP-CTERM sorting domain-containing protein [Pirellulales bacterium]|nr:PEP-CTERM sorting domain-containing protein [Pirellulales bacterium]